MKPAGSIASAMNDVCNIDCPAGPGDQRRERLEYLADLLGELQQIAEREGCRRLARLLAISYAEAMRESLRRSA